MSHHMTALAMKQSGLKPAAKIVLYWLADHHNGETGRCNPSIKRLAEVCEMSRRTVENQLKLLQEAGLVSIRNEMRERGGKSANSYVLHMVERDAQNLRMVCAESAHGVCAESAHDRTLEDTNLGNEPIDRDQDRSLPQQNSEPETPTDADLFGEAAPPADKQDEVEVRFAEFWAAYPRCKRKTDKPKAKKLFRQIVTGKHKDIDGTPCEVIVRGVERYAATNPDPEYIPLPTTWLNGERWQAHATPPDETRVAHKRGDRPFWEPQI